MIRSIRFSAVLIALVAFMALIVPTMASASHISIPATWDFETSVDPNEWSTTTRTEYFYTLGTEPEVFSSHALGPLSTSSLVLALMDVFIEASPYRFSFDLVLLGPNSLDGFTVTSHGNVILGAADLVGLEQIGSVFGGGAIAHFDSLVSPGPVPQGGPGSCCGDVVIEWFLPAGTQWGIDNFVLQNVPEPNTTLMLGLGLALLARRR